MASARPSGLRTFYATSHEKVRWGRISSKIDPHCLIGKDVFLPCYIFSSQASLAPGTFLATLCALLRYHVEPSLLL